jgi:glycosyltransferase involved in cell wall biosynthesis
MDILFINHRDVYHPQAGGAEEVIYEVGKRLAKNNKVTWVSEKVKGRKNVEVIDGIKIKRIGNKYTLHLLSPFEASKHKIVIDSIAHAVPFFSFVTNEKSIALIHHVHQDVLKFELNPLIERVIKRMEKYVKDYDHLISVSYTTKKDLIEKLGVEERKIKVIYNGIDHEKYKPGEKSPYPLILWIGRMKKYKNPFDAIEIYKRIKSKAQMVVVGSGELAEEFKKAAEPLGIKYLGRVDEKTKIELYQKAWIILSTSFIEGWGMTIVEANACGTPAVAYNTGSMPEIIKEGKNGFIVEYKNYEEAAKAIDYTFENQGLFKSSLEESYKYDWDKTAKEYEEYLKSLFY